jgi:uncharacterized membrane protein
MRVFPAAALLAAALVAVLPGPAAAQTYRLTRIPVPVGYESISISGLNNLGQVVGTAFPPFDPNAPIQGRAFVWSAGSGVTLLPLLGTGQAAGAADINDAGVVVGNAFDVPIGPGGPPAVSRPVRWTGGMAMRLPFTFGPNDLNAGASAINSAGEIAGVVPGSVSGGGGANFNTRAARWNTTGTTITPLEEPAPGMTEIGSINNAGVVVGGSAYPGGTNFFADIRPYRWNGTAATPLPRLGMDPNGRATDINTGGTIAGVSGVADPDFTGDILGTAVLWPAAGGGPMALGALGPMHNTLATSINDAGTVVGNDVFIDLDNQTAVFRAVLWGAGGTVAVDLSTLIDPSTPGWDLIGAARINNAGQIIGTGTFNGAEAAYFAAPIPAPGGSGVMVVAAALAVRRRRR